MLRNFQHPPGSGRLRSFIASETSRAALSLVDDATELIRIVDIAAMS